MTFPTESPEDYELFHYVVKGMKWGVRRKQIGSVATVPVGLGTTVACLSVAAKGAQDVYNISRANR